MAKKKQTYKKDDISEKNIETNEGFNLNETLKHLLNVPPQPKNYPDTKKKAPKK